MFAAAIICAMTADHRVSSQGESDPSSKRRTTARGSLSPGSGVRRLSSRSILLLSRDAMARLKGIAPSSEYTRPALLPARMLTGRRQARGTLARSTPGRAVLLVATRLAAAEPADLRSTLAGAPSREYAPW